MDDTISKIKLNINLFSKSHYVTYFKDVGHKCNKSSLFYSCFPLISHYKLRANLIQNATIHTLIPTLIIILKTQNPILPTLKRKNENNTNCYLHLPFAAFG